MNEPEGSPIGPDRATKEFVEKKIMEARAVSSEAMVRILIALAGILGVIAPIILSINLNARVDSSIKDMEARFDKLSSSLNPRPDLKIYTDQISLDGYRFACDSVNNKLRCQIINEGHATARSVRILLLTNMDVDYLGASGGLGDWNSFDQPSLNVEEPGYKRTLYLSSTEVKIDVSEPKLLEIIVPVTNLAHGEYQNMLKVYCEDEAPKKFRFTVIVNRGTK